MSKLSALSQALNDVYQGNASEDGVRIWLDTGFKPLNKALSGRYNRGLPCGRIIELFGGESCGKTAIATSSMISAQKQGGVAMFMDHERSFMPDLAEKMGLCIDPKVGNFVYQKPRTLEESFDKMVQYLDLVRSKKLIPDEAPIVCVFDSLAAMNPKSKFAKGMEDQGMNDSLALAKACSSCFPVLQTYADEYNACILVLNQVRENPGVMFGDNTTTPGGKAPKFYASIRVALNRSVEKDKSGQTIKAKVVKNKVSAPFKEAKWEFKFREDGTGFLDSLSSSIDHLVDIGILKRAGAYIEYNGKKMYRSALIEAIEKSGRQQDIYDMMKDDD